ncbi:MAG: hypothetical protein QQN63_12740 [Nitrosopumilus sp.]
MITPCWWKGRYFSGRWLIGLELFDFGRETNHHGRNDVVIAKHPSPLGVVESTSVVDAIEGYFKIIVI